MLKLKIINQRTPRCCGVQRAPSASSTSKVKRPSARMITEATSRPGEGEEHMDEASMRAALEEALLLLKAAQKLAKEQTKQELMDSWRAEETSSSQTARFAPSSETAVVNFWIEQGLNEAKSSALTKELLRRDPYCNVEQMYAKLNRLTRVLPEVDLPELVFKDSQVLDMNIGTAVDNLVTFVQLLPNRDIIAMVAKQPRLLWCEDLGARVPRVLKKLAQLHPSRDTQVVSGLVEEYPELLYRMDYYMEATLLDDLPIEIQNMMIIADKGIGYLYNYWRDKKASSTKP